MARGQDSTSHHHVSSVFGHMTPSPANQLYAAYYWASACYWASGSWHCQLTSTLDVSFPSACTELLGNGPLITCCVWPLHRSGDRESTSPDVGAIAMRMREGHQSSDAGFRRTTSLCIQHATPIPYKCWITKLTLKLSQWQQECQLWG